MTFNHDAGPGKTRSGKAQAAGAMAVIGLLLLGLFFHLQLFNPVYYIGVLGLALGSFGLLDRAAAEIKASAGRTTGLPVVILGKVVAGLAAVISIWAAVADLEGFYKFQAKARQSEAKTNLGSIRTAQEDFFNRNQRPPKSFSELGWKPEGKNRYSYYIARDTIPAADGGPYRLPKEIADRLAAGEGVAAAVGNIDRDAALDVWVIAPDQTLDHPLNDLDRD